MRLQFTLLSLLLLFSFGCKNTEEGKREGKVEAQEIEKVVAVSPEAEEKYFQDLEGNAVALSDYRGKRVVLNYWATWCKPCIAEMPSMVQAQEILADENYIFLLATDQSVKTIERFIEVRGYEFNYVKVPGTLKQEGFTAIPVTVIYNEKGEKVDTIVGGVTWDSPEMIQKLRDVR
ncbi:MAG: TlpA family protein disulfide reductase [Flavobacteriaceae bacterium]|nr:TlpA family protein disulfide reductase [Flavobacteriaceae bacterium]